MTLPTQFSALFDEQNVNLEASKARWNSRAAEVSAFTVSDNDFALNQVQRNLDLKGKSVLEISFGAGRHLVEFLKRGANISGVEISENMLAHTAEKLNSTGIGWESEQLVLSPWESIDMAQRQWENAFDLVFLYMSPALSSTAMLKKALLASKHHLSISLYSHREDHLLTRLQKKLGLEVRPVGSKSTEDIYLIFNILYGWGYFPQLHFEVREHHNKYQPNYILERYASWLWRGPIEEQNRDVLLPLLQEWADESGQIKTESRDIVGHLWLDKRIRR